MAGIRVEQLSISGCWVGTPRIYSDNRGDFFEWFQDLTFTESVGSNFQIAQANCSKSNKGVIRGIHFARQPPGQAKYVTCLAGRVFDVVVGLRIGSPTFGKWESILLDSTDPKVVYIPSGIGHAFMALDDNSIFVYLCDQRYNPENEFDINPLDGTLNIAWPKGIEPVLSQKDLSAKSFNQLMEIYPHFNSW